MARRNNSKQGKSQYDKRNQREVGNSKSNFKPAKKQGNSDTKERARNLKDNYGRGNDPAWYNRNTQLIHDAARIPWAYPTGLKYTLDTDNRFHLDPAAICVLETIPIPGLSADAVSPINLAASGLYQYTRKHLSTVANYMMADQFMVNLAIDGVYTLWAHITRLFGMVNLYSARNLNVNRNLVCAIYGWHDEQFDEFLSNFANYQTRFNNLILEASTLYMPTNYDVTRRHTWMYANYFTDVESVRAQYYAYTPKFVYKLNETELDTGTSLEPVSTSNLTAQGLIDRFKELIDALRTSDLVQMVMADERRAYEDGSFYTLAYVNEQFVLPPAYSKEALLQIHNSTILGFSGFNDSATVGNYNLWVTQNVDTDRIYFNPIFMCDQIWDQDDDDAPNSHDVPSARDLFRFLTERRILDCAWDSPSEDEILELTRNTATLDPVQGGFHTAHFSSLNCDIITQVRIYGPGWHSRDSYPIELDSNLLHSAWSHVMAAISVFDWAPILWVPTNDTRIPYRDFTVLGDINCFTIIDSAALARLNNNVQLSMWSVPELGSYDGK